MIALEIQHVKKYFDGVQAIDDVSIAIEQGKITSIIGPNGSGKSTLVNILCGMFPMTAGCVIRDGAKLSSINAADLPLYGMTRTFQDVHVFEQMTVLDNILVVLTERNVFSSLFERHGAYHETRAQDVLERVGLWQKRHELARQLSYGQRKLLEIARALAMNVEIFLLDEPFAGLFPEMVKQVAALLEELRTQGKTIILIEHNMSLIRQLSDQVIVMDAGKILAEGAPEDVLSRANVLEAYLGR